MSNGRDVINGTNTWGAQIRQMATSLVLTGLVAFVASWYNGQLQQRDLNFRLDVMEKRQEQGLIQVNQNTLTIQQNAIKLAEISIIQNNLAEQIREIKANKTGRYGTALQADKQWWALETKVEAFY